MSETDDILVFIVNYFKSLPEKFRNFISTDRVRFGVVLVIVLLNVYNYKHNKAKNSKKNCIDIFGFKVYCSSIIYYRTLLQLFINLYFLYTLEKIFPKEKKTLPNYWWSFIILIAFLLIEGIKGSSKLVEKDDTFNPPPLDMIRYKKRVMWGIITLIICILSLYIEYINKNDNKLIMIRLSSLIITVISLNYTIKFATCKYNLPDSWSL